MRKTVALVALGVFVSLAAACDPCVATTNCASTAPRIAIDGQIVRAEDGRGVDGVQVDAVRTGGVSTATDSFSVVTSGGGFWHIDSPASTAGQATFSFRVHTPLLPYPYVIAGRKIATTTHGGDAVVLERWVTQPYASYYVDLFLRSTGGVVPSVPVQLRRRSTNWVAGSGTADSVVGSVTDGTGRLQLYVVPGDTGDVVGDLVVNLPDPLGQSVLRDIALKPTYVYHAPSNVLRAGVGPSLDYVIQVNDRATGKSLAGVSFQATRVRGVQTTVPSGTGVTDKDGYARFPFRALATGSLVFDVTYLSPRGTTETYRDSMSTFDDDTGRLLANQSIGPYLNYYGLLESGFQSPLVGVPVRVRRTGGVAVSPADTVVLTTPSGAIPINAVPATAGDVIYELTFNLPNGFPRFKVSNLVVSTMQEDVPAGKVVWVWDVNNPLSAPPGGQITPIP